MPCPPSSFGAADQDESGWGRLALGFGAWERADLHSKVYAAAAFGHAGVGGCDAFACPTSGLSVCVMKNAFGDAEEAVAIVKQIRRALDDIDGVRTTSD